MCYSDFNHINGGLLKPIRHFLFFYFLLKRVREKSWPLFAEKLHRSYVKKKRQPKGISECTPITKEGKEA